MSLPSECPVQGCAYKYHPKASTNAHKEHCQQVHGYPTCTKCFRTLKNVRLFEEHVTSHHPTNLCSLCDVDVVVGAEKHHAEAVHGFPKCALCSQTFKKFDNFIKHVSAHTTSVCQFPKCTDNIVSGQEARHAAEKHGFPNCLHCSETFERWDKFYIHVSAHTTSSCLFPGCTDMVVNGQESVHTRNRHGYPNCEHCGEHIASDWFGFFKHVTAHTRSQCQFPGCTDEIVNGLEGKHAREKHGFPTCPHCCETFERYDKFYIHVAAHTFTQCTFPGCEHTVPSGTGADHAAAFHNFPVCPSCSDVIAGNYENFYAHVRAAVCEPPELRPCPYPNCTSSVYTNRSELTIEHLTESHDGLACTKCGMEKHTYTSVPLFLTHIEKCYNTRAQLLCEFCGLQFRTRCKFESHTCAPSANALTAEQAMVKIGSGLRPYPFLVEVSGMSRSTPFSFCVQLYNSTLRVPHELHMRRFVDVCRSRPGFARDPTSAEIVSICDGPILLYLAPHEFPLIDKIKFAYRMMQEPPWCLWVALVDRVASMSVDRWARDVHFLRDLLSKTRLPSFIDPRFADYDVIRAHMQVVTMRAKMDNMELSYTTQSGGRHDFKKLTKLLDKAHKQQNVALIPESMLPRSLPDPHLNAIDTSFPVVPASRTELEWEQVLLCFTRKILVPVVESKLFPLLSSVNAVRNNFLGTNLCLAEKFAEELHHFRTTENAAWDDPERVYMSSAEADEFHAKMEKSRSVFFARQKDMETRWPELTGLNSSEQELKARELGHMVTEITASSTSIEDACVHPRRKYVDIDPDITQSRRSSRAKRARVM